MFRRRRAAGARADGPPPRLAHDRVVRTAEEIVRRAWAYELLRRRDHLDLALSAAVEARAAAQARLAAARWDGNPWTISAAHAAALRASQVAEEAVITRRQGRRALRGELRQIARNPMEDRRGPDPLRPAPPSNEF